MAVGVLGLVEDVLVLVEEAASGVQTALAQAFGVIADKAGDVVAEVQAAILGPGLSELLDFGVDADAELSLGHTSMVTAVTTPTEEGVEIKNRRRITHLSLVS